MESVRRHAIWIVVAIVGAFALGTVALARGETISALWVVAAALCTYLIAYRYYSLFLAERVLRLDATRITPAWRHNDGMDYVPTHPAVLYGHHFAAIAGAGMMRASSCTYSFQAAMIRESGLARSHDSSR